MTTIERNELIKRVDIALDTVRPHLKVDGGDVEVVDVTDDYTVKVKWLGSCENCNMSFMTMKAGIEMTIKGQMPEINGIMAVNGVVVA